eukprot:1349129-Rhodomonas_salina.3
MAAVHACVVEMAVQAAEMLTRETLPGQSAGPRSQGSSADGCALIRGRLSIEHGYAVREARSGIIGLCN